jgi:hypothetical protein
LNDLDQVLRDGIIIPNIGNVKFYIKHFIGDHPARAKFINMKKYNGEYGCTICLNPRESVLSTMVFSYAKIDSHELRTETSYKKHLKDKSHGVYGDFYFSSYIRIPTNICLDFMHTSCLGLMKHLLELWNDRNQVSFLTGNY